MPKTVTNESYTSGEIATKQKYPLHSDSQRKIDSLFLDLVAVDGLPFDIVNGKAFRRLINTVCPPANIKSRQALRNQLDKAMKTSKEDLREIINQVGEKQLHIIVDMWTSNDHQSVLGIKGQYMNSSYELVVKTLAFASFKDPHTGLLIEKKTHEILKGKNINPNKIGVVMADNAKNMIKAFQMTEVSGFDDVEESSDEEDDFKTIEITESEEWNRLGCIAHTLQLAINEALKLDATAKEVSQYLNGIMVFFHRHPQCMATLKDETGYGLPNISKTRWNSILRALERFITKVSPRFMNMIHFFEQFVQKYVKKYSLFHYLSSSM